MVYQECDQSGPLLPGLSLAEADVLSVGCLESFGAEEFERARMRFERCRQKEYAQQPRGVAAGEVLLDMHCQRALRFICCGGYQSLYLKAHFPLEYMVATVNNGGGFYSVELSICMRRECSALPLRRPV